MIGGNVHALLQVKDTSSVNDIGERVTTWTDCAALLGWLDLSAGDSKHVNYNAKVQESTHVFLCDFNSLKNLSTDWVYDPFNFLTGVINKADEQKSVDVTSENARLVVNGTAYEILLIDNPMGMNRQLEIYLRYVGGGLGVN